MGGNSSREPDEGKMQGARVDVDLKMQQVAELFKFKVLLLGAGESGKSTIVKQLKLVHKQQLQEDEKQIIAQSLHVNVVDCIKSLIGACKTFGLEIDDEWQGLVSELNDFTDNGDLFLNEEYAQQLTDFFATEAIQAAFARRNEFWLLDSFPYYMDNIFRFAEDGFIPNEEDIIMARVRTTGIVVTELEQPIVQDHEHEADRLRFQVVDVGGQRNERKKWFHCFDDVKAILFIVNLAGYNQVLFEDTKKNRIEESLELFEKVCNNQIFNKTPIFVFLNKKDLFEKMIKEVDMNNVFKDYTGGKNTDNAIDYIKGEFKKRCPPGKEVQFECVSARVRSDIRNAFGIVKRSLYNDNRPKILEEATTLHKEAAKAQKAASGGGGGGCCVRGGHQSL